MMPGLFDASGGDASGGGRAREEGAGRAGERGKERSRTLLWILLALTAGAHLLFALAEPEPRLFEDEPHYALLAYEDARQGERSLAPWRLRFDSRPELVSRLWSLLVPPGEAGVWTRPQAEEDTRLQRRARWLNLFFLLGTLALVWRQAEVLGLGRAGAAVALVLLAAFPWFGFYVHTLWPEMLHAVFAAAALVGILLHLRGGRLRHLAAGGLAAGWALLAKGTLFPFGYLALPFLAVVAFARAEGGLARRSAAALLPPLVFAAAAVVVALPLALANLRAGEGFRLAANRWKNLEMGLLLEPRELQTPKERAERARLHHDYMASGASWGAREDAARQRTLAHLRGERWSVALEQGRKLRLLLLRVPSFFERALQERWGDPPPRWLASLRAPGRLCYALLVLGGLAGVLMTGWRGPGWIFLSLFLVWYALALFAIPYKMRFSVQALPTLALFTGAAVERLAAALTRSRAGG